MAEEIKLNLGCGQHKKDGFINVDKSGDADLIHNLEIFPWPWEDNAVSYVLMHHVLEHLGEKTDVFLHIIKELYRVSMPDATIEVTVPNPRHDYFINDPTHVRPITKEVMDLFSKQKNLEWKENGISNSPLALYLDVDFEVIDHGFVFAKFWAEGHQKKEISDGDLNFAATHYFNVVEEISMLLKVVK